MKKTSVLVVDDHSVVRMGLSAIINLEADLHVCGEADCGETAVRLAGELKPDVVIMDLVMRGMDGAETTKEVLKDSPSSRVLILTTFGTSIDIVRALSAGATGAATKDLSNADLAGAIRAVAGGRRYFSPEIEVPAEFSGTTEPLSDRQREVLDAIARGLSNNDIAKLLGISECRVKQHLKRLYAKLGTANRSETVAFALKHQLLKS